MVPIPREIYILRKQQVFDFLKVILHDPAQIKSILESYSESSIWGKVKVVSKGTQFLYKHRKGLSALNFMESFYYPEAIKFIEILKGERLDSQPSNFYIQLLKDPDTKAFFKDHELVLEHFLKTLAPPLLSIVIKLKSMKRVMDTLAKMKIDENYIRAQLLPDLLAYVQIKLNQPEKILDILNSGVAVLSAPMTPLRKKGILFGKKLLPIIFSFLQEPFQEVPNKAIISIIAAFFVKRKNTTLISNISSLVHRSELEILASEVPSFLMANKADIIKKMTSSLEAMKQKSGRIPQDFSKELLQNLLETVINLSEDLLPFGMQVLQKIFLEKNTAQLLILFDHIQALKDKPVEGDQQIKLVMGAIFALDIDHYIFDHFPAILEKHAHPLDAVLKEFLSQTQKGRELILFIQTHKVLAMTSRHMPQIASIIRAYTRGDPWVWQGCQLLKDKAVLKLVFETLCSFLVYKYRQHLQTALIRRLRIGEPIKSILKSYQPGDNLGQVFKHNAKMANNTLEYSLIKRDLSGLNLSDELCDLTIEDFKFDHATLESISFKNSTIINCSFKDVHFKHKPNFGNIKIDAISLATLKPSIERYNRKHPHDTLSIPEATLFPPKNSVQPSFLKNK